MAYKIERRTVRLVLEDYQGAEVVVRTGIPLRTRFELAKMGDQDRTLQDSEGMLTRFANECLVSWDIVDEDGTAVPANAEGFLSLPFQMAEAIMLATLEEINAPPDPLSGVSPNGKSRGRRRR